MPSTIPSRLAFLLMIGLTLAACASHSIPSADPRPNLLADSSRQPAAHPDGRLLAVQAVIPGRIYRSELFLFGRGDPERLTLNTTFDGYPAWSPDGTELAYTSGSPDDPSLLIRDLETGRSRTLISRRAIQPCYTADGAHVLFVRLEEGGSSIQQVRLLDGSVRELVPPDGVHHSPVAHPGGRLVLYVRGRGADTDVWAVDRETRQRTPVLASPHREQHPSISPDGRWLVIASDRPLPDGRRPDGNALWLVDLAGEKPEVVHPVAVPEEGFSYAESAFYPQGRRLAAALQGPRESWQVMRVDLDLP